MSDFFEERPPREPEPERRHRMPAWFGAPEGQLAGVVPLELLLARTERVAVAVVAIRAFTEGFAFELVTLAAPEVGEELDPFLFGGPHRRGRDGQGLRFGVEFADGRRATNVFEDHAPGGGPPGIAMHSGGGGGGGASWHQDYWVWPLPPPGPLAFACDWDDAGIPLTRRDIDAQAVLEASARAQVVFDDSHLPPWPDDEDGPEIVRIR